MSIQVQRPRGGPDVSRRNIQDILYVKGDDVTNGSRRFIFDPVEEDVRLEAREFNLNASI